MKINIHQINPKTLWFDTNKQNIIGKLSNTNNDVLNIFPELTISGSPLYNAIDYDDTFVKSSFACEQICLQRKNVLFGSPLKIENNKYNALIFIHEGEVIGFASKKNLNQFDYGFSEGEGLEIVTYQGKQVAFGFIEDLADFIREGRKVDTIIICSNTPFHLNSQQELYSEIIPQIRKLQTSLVCISRTGAEAGYIYSGESFVMNKRGELCAIAKLFEEDELFVDLSNIKPINQNPISKMELLYNALVLGIKDYFNKNGIKKAVIGLSGGIDSALVVVLGVEALGKENVVGVLMPSEYSTDHSIKDALDSAKKLGIEHHIVPIKDTFDTLINTIHPVFSTKEFSLSEENVQSRLRLTNLMWVANRFNAGLLNTSNKSEAAVGYGTLYGDTSGAIAPIADIYKTEVWELSRWINRNEEIIPWNSINKAPSAELRPGQKDSDSLPEYDILDTILFNHIEQNKTSEEIIKLGFDKEIVQKIIRLVKINEWKRRQCPMAVKVSKCCFGIDRKMPIS